MHSKAIPLLLAQSQVAGIFSINDVNENGKPVMRCSRCDEGVAKVLWGKTFQLLAGSITKAKEHIAIYCSKFRPEVNASDANLRHTLLISMSTKHVASMTSKKTQSLRKLLFLNIDCLYCQLSILYNYNRACIPACSPACIPAVIVWVYYIDSTIHVVHVLSSRYNTRIIIKYIFLLVINIQHIACVSRCRYNECWIEFPDCGSGSGGSTCGSGGVSASQPDMFKTLHVSDYKNLSHVMVHISLIQSPCT
jgi:hypothetical protein